MKKTAYFLTSVLLFGVAMFFLGFLTGANHKADQDAATFRAVGETNQKVIMLLTSPDFKKCIGKQHSFDLSEN